MNPYVLTPLLLIWLAAPMQAFFASSGNFVSPDNRWVVEWTTRPTTESIVLKSNATGKTICKLTPRPKFTVIKWNDASNKVAISHGPDGVDPIFIVFENDPAIGWKQYALSNGGSLTKVIIPSRQV